MTDRSDAFKHNSCKKLAQLAKVIFTMSTQILDRKDEAADLIIEFENLIQKAVNDYHDDAESIAKDLVHFRKKCVDDSCKEFGSLYKQLKLDYANIKQKQGERLAQLLHDAQNQQNIVKSAQNQALLNAAAAMRAADEFAAGVKAHQKRPSTARRELRNNVQPIFEKMDQAQAESDERIRMLRRDFVSKMASSKKEIAQFVRDELRNRRPHLQEMKTEIVQLNADIKDIKSDFASTIQHEKEFYKKKHQARDEIMKKTKEAFAEIARQMKTVRLSDNRSNKQHGYLLSDLKAQLQRRKNDHKNQIESLRRQIKEQKRIRHQFRDRTGFELQKRKDALGVVTAEMLKAQKNQVKKKNNIHKAIIANINECENDTNRILNFLRQQFDDSMSRMDNKVLALQYKIEAQEADADKRYSDEKEFFVSSVTERVEAMIKSVESQIDFSKISENKQIKRNRHIRHEIKRGDKAFHAAYDEADQKAKSEFNNAINYNNERIDVKKRDIESSVRRKQAEKDKKLTELRNNYSGDIKKQENEIQAKNEKVLDDFRQEENQKMKIDKEIREHELDLAKLNAKNDFLSKRMVELKEESVKMEEKLQSEISSLEKAQRQFARRTKAETTRLDEEYEMKIQIAQIKLRDTIDNISKLYDPDENQRGCDIIEGIRKVREAKNRTNDIMKRKEDEIKAMKKEFDAKISEMKIQIEKYESYEKENELRAKIDEMRNFLDNEMDDLSKSTDDQIVKIRKKIEDQKILMANELTELNSNRFDAESYYSSQVEEIDAERKKFDDIKAEQIKEIDKKYDELFVNQRKEHESSLEKMKKRIEAAQSNYDEALNKQNSEIEELKSRNIEELRRKRKENDQSLENVFSNDYQQSDLLSQKIEELTQKQSDIEFSIFDQSQRASDKTKIEFVKHKIEIEDEKQAKTFETFYNAIKEAPNKANDEEALTAMSRPSTTSKSNRKEKTPRVMTPTITLESKMRKRPQLVAPQLA